MHSKMVLFSWKSVPPSKVRVGTRWAPRWAHEPCYQGLLAKLQRPFPKLYLFIHFLNRMKYTLISLVVTHCSSTIQHIGFLLFLCLISELRSNNKYIVLLQGIMSSYMTQNRKSSRIDCISHSLCSRSGSDVTIECAIHCWYVKSDI